MWPVEQTAYPLKINHFLFDLIFPRGIMDLSGSLLDDKSPNEQVNFN